MHRTLSAWGLLSLESAGSETKTSCPRHSQWWLSSLRNDGFWWEMMVFDENRGLTTLSLRKYGFWWELIVFYENRGLTTLSLRNDGFWWEMMVQWQSDYDRNNKWTNWYLHCSAILNKYWIGSQSRVAPQVLPERAAAYPSPKHSQGWLSRDGGWIIASW